MRDFAWLVSRCDCIDDCMLWAHSVQSKGYPQANFGGKHKLVQRYAYTEIYGKFLPHRWVVSAKCGNKLCCAEKCLIGQSRGKVLAKAYANGNRSQNMELGARQRIAKQIGLVRKLDMTKAREIRAKRPTMTLHALAAEYGVNPDTISRVCQQRLWREHINGSSVFGWRP